MGQSLAASAPRRKSRPYSCNQFGKSSKTFEATLKEYLPRVDPARRNWARHRQKATNSYLQADRSGDDPTEAETSIKPHPDVFEAALAALRDVARDAVVVVGDTPYDAQADAEQICIPIGSCAVRHFLTNSTDFL
jgi:hypothetical protein